MDNSAQAGFVYEYAVRALGAGGVSTMSTPDSGQAQEVVSLPTALTLQRVSGDNAAAVSLDWGGQEGVRRYRIYRSAQNNPSGSSLLGSTGLSRYTDSTIRFGERFYYWVVGSNDAGVGPFSNAVAGSRCRAS